MSVNAEYTWQIQLNMDVHHPRRVAIVAAGAVGAVVLFRVVMQLRKRRRLMAKIKAFQQAESERRAKLRARTVPEEQESAVLSLSFANLANLLRQGELKAVDVLHVYQKAALASSARTNAITEFIIERAEKTAAKLDAVPLNERKPLHGVPITIKECCFYPGTESTGGFSQYLGQFLDAEPAPVITFLESLGCIPFAKTNIPQAMLSYDSRNAIYGQTLNPHNLKRSPGGSSSGEGAIVGGKGSILGVGSDVGGSLRIPAAWCGCYTLKPSSFRMLNGGTFPTQYFARALPRDFQTVGFLTQDVDTLVTLHRLMYNAETFKKYPVSTLTPIPFQEDLFSSKAPLTIGFCDFDGVVETTPAMKRAIRLAKESLELRGHRLVHWTPPNAKDAALLYFRLMSVDGYVETIKACDDDVEIAFPNIYAIKTMKTPYWLKCLISDLIRPFVGDYPADVIKNLRFGSRPHDVNVEYRSMRKYRQEFAEAFHCASLDALLYPTYPSPSVPLDSPRDLLGTLCYNTIFNLLDWPSGVSQITTVNRSDEQQMESYPGNRDLFHRVLKRDNVADTIGLPLSIQVVAPQYNEEVILRVMSELQATKTANDLTLCLGATVTAKAT